MDGSAVRRGWIQALPVSVAVFACGSAFGALAGQQGFGWKTLTAMDLALFSGSAQFVLLGTWGAGGDPVQSALAAAAVNLRYLLLCAAAAPWLASLPWGQRLLRVHLITDENWALTTGAGEGTASADHLLGGGLCVLGAWLLGTLAGWIGGRTLMRPEALGLDFAFAGVFTALAVSSWRGRSDLLPWAVAAAAALGTHGIFPQGAILAGGAAGAAVCALRGGRRKG